MIRKKTCNQQKLILAKYNHFYRASAFWTEIEDSKNTQKLLSLNPFKSITQKSDTSRKVNQR